MRFATTMLAAVLLFAGNTTKANETDAEAEWFKQGAGSFTGKGSAFGRLNDKFASISGDAFGDDDHERYLGSYGVSVPHKSDYVDYGSYGS